MAYANIMSSTGLQPNV